MQFQSDILNCAVVKPSITETTALGAAYLAGLAVGFWKDIAEIENYWKANTTFKPAMDEIVRSEKVNHWKRSVAACQAWANYSHQSK